jgi:hypothetical protein
MSTFESFPLASGERLHGPDFDLKKWLPKHTPGNSGNMAVRDPSLSMLRPAEDGICHSPPYFRSRV